MKSLFLALFLFCNLLFSQENHHTIVLDSVPSYEHFLSFFPLNKTCSAYSVHIEKQNGDIKRYQKEVEYIFDGASSVTEFYYAIKRLQAQGLFDSVDMRIKDDVYSYSVAFTVKMQWVLKKVDIIGVAYGKHTYKQLYEIGYGEPFSILLHEKSLEAIQEYVHNQGYFSAQVQAYFSFDEETHSVSVRIVIDKKNHYKIDQVDTVFASCIIPKNLCEKIHDKLKRSLCGYCYTHDFMQKKIQVLKNFLEDEGYFVDDITIEKSLKNKTDSLKIIITLLCHKQKQYEFFGNHFFSVSYLQSFVADIQNNITHIPDHMLQQELQELYNSYGFLHAKVETQQESTKTVFVITQGQRAQVKSIVVKGVSLTTYPWVKRFLERGIKHRKFYKNRIKTTIKKVISQFISLGYYDARLLQYKYAFDTHLNNAVCTLELAFDKGKLYCFNDCLVHDDASLQNHIIKKFKEYKQHAPITEKALKAQQKWLYEYCKKQVKSLSDVTYTLEPFETEQSDNVLCKIVWNIKKIPNFYFGKTVIKGSSVCSYRTIRNFLGYHDGDSWDTRKVQKSLARFKSLGVFESLSLRPLFLHNNIFQDCLLTLQDDDPYEIKMRLGYQQISKNFAFHKGSSYKAGAAFIMKNPFKKLDKIVCSADVSYFEQRLFSAYSRPFLMRNTVCEGIAKIYANNYKQPISLTSKTAVYQATQQGFLCGITSMLSTGNVGLSCGCEWLETKDVAQNVAQALYFESTLINKKVPYVFFEPTFFLQALDNMLDPSSGLFFLVTAKAMMPLKTSASYFVRCLLEQGVFIPLSYATCALRMRCGHIFKESFKNIMPPDRFYLGGANTVRSYQMDKCPPLGSFMDASNTMQWVAQGGKTMYNMNFELRFPLQHMPLSLVAFQDVGFLAHDVEDVFTHTPLAATGFGIRYATPIGPLRFDIGWKWNKQHPQEPHYAWFLTFGHAF